MNTRGHTIRRAFALGGLVVVAPAAALQASAAQVSVASTDVISKTVLPCTAATIVAAPATLVSGVTYRAVRISGIPASCNNLPIIFTIHRANNNSYRTGSGNTGATGTVTITTNNTYSTTTAAGIRILINTWFIPNTNTL